MAVVVMTVMAFAFILAVPFVAIAFFLHFPLVVTIAHFATIPFSFPVSITVPVAGSVSVLVAITLAGHLVSMWPFREEARSGNGSGCDCQK